MIGKKFYTGKKIGKIFVPYKQQIREIFEVTLTQHYDEFSKMSPLLHLGIKDDMLGSPADIFNMIVVQKWVTQTNSSGMVRNSSYRYRKFLPVQRYISFTSIYHWQGKKCATLTACNRWTSIKLDSIDGVSIHFFSIFSRRSPTTLQMA